MPKSRGGDCGGERADLALHHLHLHRLQTAAKGVPFGTLPDLLNRARSGHALACHRSDSLWVWHPHGRTTERRGAQLQRGAGPGAAPLPRDALER